MPRASAGATILTSDQIAAGVIIDSDINASAAIALSKLATDPLARANHTGQDTLADISDYPAAASQAEAEAGTEAAAREFTPVRIKQAIDALGSIGEKKSVIVPGMGAISGAAFVQHATFGAAVEFSDAAQEAWLANVVVPEAANGLGITSIEVIFDNQDGGAAKNLVIRAEMWEFGAGQDGAKATDTTGTERVYATSGNGSDKTGIITLNGDVFDGLSAALSTNDILGLSVKRIGDSGSDTYAVAWDVIAIIITYA